MTKTTEKHIVQINQSQAPYTIQENGDWLVVPVVMMTEGVRSGSQGPILHREEFYSQNPEVWNGAPVTAGHPETSNGEFVSVNAVNQDQWVVGHLRNAHVEDGKLKADVYINEQRAIAVNPEILNYLEAQRPIEVSIGAFTRDKPESGTYENEEYNAVTVTYQPDHLALLPGERGACSWQDGCGIRNNKESESEGGSMDEYFQALKQAIKEEGGGVIDRLQDNAVGFIELSSMIQSRLDRMDSDIRIHFLQEIFDDRFIYKVRNTDTGESNFYQLEYNVTEEEEVEFEGEPQPVRRNVEFVPMQSNKDDEDCTCEDTELKRTKYNTNNNSEDNMSDTKEKETPSSEVVTKVVSLVNNEQTHFTEGDRDWLLNLNQSQLNKLEPKEAPEPEVSKEDAVQALQEELSDVDKLTDIVSDDVAEKVKTGLDTYQNIRENLIDTIQSNTSEEDWPKDELESMSTNMLKKLAKTVKPADYSGKGPVNNSSQSGQGSEEEPLLPAGVAAE